MLRLAAWIASLGYFNEVNFIFLVVGHTKNAADRLFNSLKAMYRLKNLYTSDQMVEALGTSRTITIHPTMSEDFLDYSKLFDFFYKKLTGRIKQNHIFTAFGLQGYKMTFRLSDLNEEYIVHIGKKGFKDMSFQDIIQHREDQLKLLEWEGLNPYKAYEPMSSLKISGRMFQLNANQIRCKQSQAQRCWLR